MVFRIIKEGGSYVQARCCGSLQLSPEAPTTYTWITSQGEILETQGIPWRDRIK